MFTASKSTLRGECTTVKLFARDSNQSAISNSKKLVVPGVPPAPSAFNGQFLHLNVVSVTLSP
jgi:hypothetical protein